MNLYVNKNINNEIIITFDYCKDGVEKMKAIFGRKWNPEKKYWTLPNTERTIEEIKSAFKNDHIIFKNDGIAFSENNRDVDLDSGIYNQNNMNKIDNFKLRQPEINKILIDMANELKLKGYSFKTKKAYLGHLKRFISYYKKDIKQLTVEDIKEYMLYLFNKDKISHSYINQSVSALKFVFEHLLHKGKVIEELPRPKKEYKLPNILSEEEVLKILEATQNLKHKAILFLTYSAGLRVSE